MEHEVLKIKKADGVYVALLKTSAKCTPYVVAWCYNGKDKSWGQGHYFETLKDASIYYRHNYQEEE